MNTAHNILRAAAAIRAADSIIITAGAGMGVDSGLPDFRGTEGFWKAYPAAARQGLRFEQLANPNWFERDPAVAWGFYGHRRNLYRATTPHGGFAILREWAQGKPGGYFVFTSNVDGHFQKAGFDADRIVECHGSLEHLQCFDGCTGSVVAAEAGEVTLDFDSLRAADPLPACPSCGKLARPNVLMFGDGGWIADRTEAQERRFAAWRKTIRKPVIIECGAGSAIPTVRLTGEMLADELDGTLIRINVRESDVTAGHFGLAMGALRALTELRECGNARKELKDDERAR